MNFKTTLVLIVLLLAVGGYFYFVEYGQISGYEAREQQIANEATQTSGKPVFTDDAPTADSIDRIRVERRGLEVMIERQDGQWFQTQPVRFSLDAYGPDAVASQFASLRYVEQLQPQSTDASSTADAPTLEQMGLDNPRAVVTAWSADKSWTLRLGRQSVDGHGYVQLKGADTAYVVDPAFHGAVLDQPINDWRSKTLNIPAPATLDHIGLHQDNIIGLTKTEGRWHIDGEGVQRASSEAIDDLIAAANRLSITGFTADNPDNLTLYGLEHPHLQLIIETPPPTTTGDATQTEAVTRRLKIGRTGLDGNARYATWTQDDESTCVVFTVNASTAQALTRSLDELRDPRAIVASPKDIREIKVQQAGETSLHVLRDPQSGYRFAEPQPGFDIDYSTSHTLIQQVCQLEATTYTAALDALGDPIADVTLGVATGSGEVRFSVFNHGDDQVILNHGEGVGYIVQSDDLVRLLGPPLGLRKRTILDLTQDQITRIALKRPDGLLYEFTHTADDPDAGWMLMGYQRFEDKTLNALLDALQPLRAEEWLPDPASQGSGWIELTVDVKDGDPKTLTLNPTDRTAALPGVESGFVLPQPTVDLFNTEYRDRTAIQIPIDQIASVRIASDATDITLSREGQQFSSDRGEVDQAVAAGAFDTLAGLRVQRYVAPLHLRPEDIDFSVELTTTDSETRTLRLINSESDTVTVTMDPSGDQDHTGWFTLDRDVVDQLRAALTEIESPTK